MSIAILSDANIRADEFGQFISSIGGVLVEEVHQYEWRYSDIERHLWIFLATDELRHFSDEELIGFRSKLGNPPQSEFIVEMSSAALIEDLALEFILKFHARWKCIVYNLRNHIASVDEISSMESSTKTEFWFG